ncbi:hypothetical protein [Microvirga sp. KLBC 81]|uniref:hypothetical protein n=1 Tax=Microvirga sp. KLBC 81 TaxID=1862707 RepID=UPI0010583894|nr:hypothetical protein [Microvirga sp. KLBC 81]
MAPAGLDGSDPIELDDWQRSGTGAVIAPILPNPNPLRCTSKERVRWPTLDSLFESQGDRANKEWKGMHHNPPDNERDACNHGDTEQKRNDKLVYLRSIRRIFRQGCCSGEKSQGKDDENRKNIQERSFQSQACLNVHHDGLQKVPKALLMFHPWKRNSYHHGSIQSASDDDREQQQERSPLGGPQ